MGRFNGNTYSTHGHFRAEIFVISFALLLVSFFAFPKIKCAYLNIKVNSVIESVNSFRENVDNYCVSQLLYDSGFKFDGTYIISDGNLVSDDGVYKILMVGNVPDGGYLNYIDNNLDNGCVSINGYSVYILNGEILSTSKGSCDVVSEVAFDM